MYLRIERKQFHLEMVGVFLLNFGQRIRLLGFATLVPKITKKIDIDHNQFRIFSPFT